MKQLICLDIIDNLFDLSDYLTKLSIRCVCKELNNRYLLLNNGMCNCNNYKSKYKQIKKRINNDNKRTFRIIFNSEIFGRYTGNSPKQAANKAFSSLYREHKIKDMNL